MGRQREEEEGICVDREREGKVVLVDKVGRGSAAFNRSDQRGFDKATGRYSAGVKMLLQQAGFTLSSKKSRRPPLWLYTGPLYKLKPVHGSQRQLRRHIMANSP